MWHRFEEKKHTSLIVVLNPSSALKDFILRQSAGLWRECIDIKETQRATLIATAGQVMRFLSTTLCCYNPSNGIALTRTINKQTQKRNDEFQWIHCGASEIQLEPTFWMRLNSNAERISCIVNNDKCAEMRWRLLAPLNHKALIQHCTDFEFVQNRNSRWNTCHFIHQSTGRKTVIIIGTKSWCFCLRSSKRSKINFCSW